MKKKVLYVGLDVHKKTIDVAIAPGRSNGKVRSYGKIDSTIDALNKLIKKLEDGDKQLRFVYEAGPCGYQIYRHLDAKGIECSVVAPSLIFRRSGDRIKTDRRDAINLVRLFRAGNPKQLMAYLGLIPSEHSSGKSVRRGPITKTGNSHVRRALIEAAWTYKMQARVSTILVKRQQGLPKSVCDISWKAQTRLCARYRQLMARGKTKQTVVTAIARELSAFICAIDKEVQFAEQ